MHCQDGLELGSVTFKVLACHCTLNQALWSVYLCTELTIFMADDRPLGVKGSLVLTTLLTTL